jgi:uncharacterized protein YcnI
MTRIFQFISIFLLAHISLSTTLSGFAHISVIPTTVETAQFQTFTVQVPTEKDIPTTKVRLVLPEGLQNVRPTSKIGWNIDVVKEGETLKEIVWSNGLIPQGQRDDFTFSAKTPANEKELVWKSYQTYIDGTEVAWDQAPKTGNSEDKKVSNPYSTTKVSPPVMDTKDASTSSLQTVFNALSIVALLASLFALARSGQSMRISQAQDTKSMKINDLTNKPTDKPSLPKLEKVKSSSLTATKPAAKSNSAKTKLGKITKKVAKNTSKKSTKK